MKRLCTLLLFLLPTLLRAQTPVQVLDAHSFTKVKEGADSLKFFNPLHSFTWAVYMVNDAGDTLRLSTSRPDTIGLKHAKAVNLAATVRVSPEYLEREFTASYSVLGSVRISLNGDTVLATGQFAPENDKLHRPEISDFVNFWFRDTTQHITITYVPHPIAKIFSLGLLMGPADRAFKTYHQTSVNNDFLFFAVGIFYLAFGIVFFVLFLYYRERIENFYLSVFCILIAVAFCLPLPDGLFVFTASAMSAVIGIEFVCLFLARLLRNKDRTKVPLVILCVLAAVLLQPSVLYHFYPFWTHRLQSVGQFIANEVLFVYECYLLVYLLVWGIRKRNWEARTIFLFGSIATALYLFLPLTQLLFPSLRTLSSESAINYLTSLALCTLPVGLAIILGRKNGENQRQLLQQEKEKQRILEGQKEALENEVTLRTAEIMQQKEQIESQHDELKVEKKRSDDLLLNILPEEVAEELKQTGRAQARLFDYVTVLFTDFVDFTKASEKMAPQELVNELHVCFEAFDHIISRYGIEKIKTIGDAYLAVCGLPHPNAAHATNAVAASLEIARFMAQRKLEHGDKTFEVRIGLHSGNVVAGIVGVKKFAYDVWGDTVNIAARMEQNSLPGKINISQTTCDLIKDKFNCTYRGDIQAKNKGELAMYFVENRK